MLAGPGRSSICLTRANIRACISFKSLNAEFFKRGCKFQPYLAISLDIAT